MKSRAKSREHDNRVRSAPVGLNSTGFFLPTTTVQETHFLLATGSRFDLTLFYSLRFRSAFVVSILPRLPSRPAPLPPVPSSTMVTLSPKFTLLATLCALAALSSAPISDAAVLRLRASDPALTNMASGHSQAGAATWFPRHSSHVVDDPPVLPLPQTSGKSYKNYADSGDSRNSLGNKDDQKIPSAGGSHEEKAVSAGDRNRYSPYDNNGAVPKEGGKVKVRISDLIDHHFQSSLFVRIGSPLEPFPSVKAIE